MTSHADEAGRCRCDQQALSLGRPFCGYCGRQLSTPPFYTPANKLLGPGMALDIPPGMESSTHFDFTLDLRDRPAKPRGWLDPQRVTDDKGCLRIVDAFLQIDGIRHAPEFQVADCTFRTRIPAAMLKQAHNAALCLNLGLEGIARGRIYLCEIGLPSTTRIDIESDDPRFELIDGIGRLLLFTTPKSAAPLPPLKLTISCPTAALSASGSARLSSPGHDRDFKLTQIEPSANGGLDVDIPLEVLNDLPAGGSTDSPLTLQLSLETQSGAAVTVSLEAVRCTLPVLELHPPARFEFKLKDGDDWCGEESTPKSLRVSRSVNWEREYELTAVPLEKPELGEAATFFVTLIDDDHDPTNGFQDVRLRIMLSPAWLYRNKKHKEAWHLGGELRLVLRNSANPSRKQADNIELARAEISIDGTARAALMNVALDFGTCNTCAAKMEDETQLLGIPLEFQEGSVVPSLLYYALPQIPISGAMIEDQVLIGQDAQAEDKASRHQDVLFRRGLKSTLLEVASGDYSDTKVKLSSQCEFDSGEMTEHFLMVYFNKLVRSKLIDGRFVETLIFTYPAESPADYRKRLHAHFENAARNAGLPFYAALQPACDEASAGGLWWFVKNNQLFENSERVTLMVYDYGGGTTDISALEFLKIPGDEGRWSLKILGVAGEQKCGGDDLTWRLAREFARCGSRGSALGNAPSPLAGAPAFVQALTEHEPLKGRQPWWNAAPGLIKMMDQYKPETVGAKILSTLPEAVIADLIEDKGSTFLPKDIQVNAKTYRPDPGRTPSGQYAMHIYDGWQVNGKELRPRANSSSPRLLGEQSWVFDLGSDEDGPLAEPEIAMQIARQLVRNLFGEGGKVDFLLLIGQASQTVYFIERLKSVLKDCYTEFADERAEAKVCVASGACNFHKFSYSQSIEMISTILRRIAFAAATGLTVKPKLVEVMKSSSERNKTQRIEVAAPAYKWLTNPKRISLYSDSSYTDDNRFSTDLKLRHKLTILREGFVQTNKPILALVADPSELANFSDEARVPKEIQNLIGEVRGANATAALGWFLCIWPESEAQTTWIYQVRL